MDILIQNEEKMLGNGQQQSFKPIPKPRKSLMNNTATMLTTTQAGAAFPLSKGPHEHLQSRPPPLPPRTVSPLQQTVLPPPTLPQRIDYEANMAGMTSSSSVDTSNYTNNTNKIYPILEDLLSQKLLATANKSKISYIPMEVTSSCSEFSSDDYHSVLDSPTLKSSVICHSLCEPFGDIKSDGESVCFSGWVQLAPQGIIKQRKRGWAMIRRNQFSISPNDESNSPFIGPVDLCKSIFLGRKPGNNSREVTLIIRDSNGKQHKNQNEESTCILRFIPEENGEYWLPLLAKCCSPRHDLLNDYPSELGCCGKLWIKQGIGGIWNEGWAFVRSRILHYWIQGPNLLTEVDIRKIILIKRKDIPISDWCNRIENSMQGPILIALEGSSLYLQAHNDQCTSYWLEFLTTELCKEAEILEECRLTSEDVPVIVDKCIRLISTYGMYLQGIYRKNGSASETKKLMAAFREDPYTVHLKSPITDEIIFAVAGVLRTFFRQLNKPLIPAEIHAQLYEILNLPTTEKPKLYQQLIDSLPKVYFKTLRKLLGHLQEIISHESRNLASLENISKVFGPNLFNDFKSDEEISVECYAMANKQTQVMRDLIFHYCEIFGVSADELLAKCKLDVIQEQKASKNPANGLLLPIHLFERDNKCFNIQSDWTAGQVVSFKIEMACMSPCESYALFEMLRGGQLERRIDANESLRSIVLGRWFAWEEHQNNFLLLKKDQHPFQPQSGRAFADDIKIAEPASRSFKSASLRIEEGTRVCQYSKGMKRQNEWKMDEMLWFVGAETDRKCPFPFALTFFVSTEKKGAKCAGKLPGYCVAFRDEIQRHQWLNCICLNQSEYLPQPLIQI